MKGERVSPGEDVLRLVRGSADPLPDHELRVLARVEQQLGLAPLRRGNSADSPRARVPRGRAGSPAARAPLKSVFGSLPRIALGATLGVSLAAIGYGVGVRQRGARQVVEQRPLAVDRVAVAPPPPLAAPEVASAPSADRAPVPEEPAVVAARSAAPRELAGTARQLPGAVTPRAVTPKVTSTAAAAPVALREALQLLEHAQAALRLGTAGDALDWLDRLEQRNPGALLEQERLVTRALALCALGERAKARDLRQRLERLDPQNIYRGQLDASCTRQAADPDREDRDVRLP